MKFPFKILQRENDRVPKQVIFYSFNLTDPRFKSKHSSFFLVLITFFCVFFYFNPFTTVKIFRRLSVSNLQFSSYRFLIIIALGRLKSFIIVRDLIFLQIKRLKIFNWFFCLWNQTNRRYTKSIVVLSTEKLIKTIYDWIIWF